ncbi:MAG: hypothetical protein GXO89_13310 [Chlorobi bacterium]|nr:hypothetical protein [Chlorobiota bacterium]
MVSIQDEVLFKPYFWVREEKTRSSEVDLVFRYGKYIFPVEIKSGKQERLRSLHQFVDRTNHPYAVLMYVAGFNVENAKTLKGLPYLLVNVPYYLGTIIPEWIECACTWY